jgi:hypothetical protein
MYCEKKKQMDLIIWIEQCEVSIPIEEMDTGTIIVCESYQRGTAPYNNMPETHPSIHAQDIPSSSIESQSASGNMGEWISITIEPVF